MNKNHKLVIHSKEDYVSKTLDPSNPPNKIKSVSIHTDILRVTLSDSKIINGKLIYDEKTETISWVQL